MSDDKRPKITIKGNVNATNFNVGEQPIHGDVSFTFSGAPAASPDLEAQLKALYQQLADALAKVPTEQANDVTEVQMAAEDALAEVQKPQPEKNRLQIRGDKLMAAAKNLLAVAPIAVEIARTLLLIGKQP
jgi:hypothetical protein